LFFGLAPARGGNGGIGCVARREAAERFEVNASSAIKWMQPWRVRGQAERGSISTLDERAGFSLALIAEQPDLAG